MIFLTKLKTNFMSHTIEQHLEKVIAHLSKQIRDGKNTNRHHLDGYTLAGLQKKHKILKECLNKLTGNK